MKRVLSIILALSLALAFFPTFASAETTETATPTAFTVNFNGADTSDLTVNTANQGTRWYVEPGQNLSGSNWTLLTDRANSNIYFRNEKTTIQYYTFNNENYITAATTVANLDAGNDTFSLKINVPTSGFYKISGNMYFGGSGGFAEILVGDQSAGTVNSNKTTNGGKTTKQPVTFPDSVFLAEGENILKIKNTKDPNASSVSNGFFGLTFTPADVTSAKIVLPEKLTIGDKALIGLELVVDGKTVICDEILDAINVTLSSDSSSVKVGEKAIAAYLEGTANITANITVNGQTFEDTKTVTVSKEKEAKTFAIDFSAPISSIDSLYEYEGNYYITSTGKMFGSNWEAVTQKSISTLLNSNRRVRYFIDSRILVYAYASDIDTSDGNEIRDTMAFDFYVPADGVYDLSAVGWKGTAGGYASLYIDDNFIGKQDFYSTGTIQNFLFDDYGRASLTAGKHRLKIVCAVSSATTSANGFCTITFTPVSEDEALKEAFAVEEAPMADYVAPSVVSVTVDGAVVNSVKNADGSHKITAPESNKDGANFLYWAKGLSNKKRIVSFSNVIENYVPEEDGANFLIAVYDDYAPTTDEYYNANGQLLATGEAPEYPSMAGYGTATAWNKYDDANIYVAEFGNKTQPDSITVTVNGTEKTVPYGTEISCTANGENFKCWTKTNINGKTEIVSADEDYKFLAWENCSVDAIYEVHAYNGSKMKIVVDSFTAGKDTGIMAEFIGFGSNVVEKGIMWNGKKIAMTKPGTQFSVVADKNGEYKGYAIVKNGTDSYTLITDGSVTVSDAK